MAFCHRWHLCQTRQRWASPTRVQGPRCRPSHAWVRSHISRVYPWPSADRFGPACWKSPDGGLQTAGRHQRPQPGSLLGGRLSHGVDDALQKHVPLDPWRWVSDAVHRGFRMVPRPIPEDLTQELGPVGACGQEDASSRAAWDPAATRTNPHGSWLSACRGLPAIASPQAASNPTSHPDLSHGGERNVFENAFGLAEFQERIP